MSRSSCVERVDVDIVIPTVGRPSLIRLLDRLDGFPGRVIVVDDRSQPVPALVVPDGVEVVRGRARGPAAARNDGWRRATATWVAFLDDDVVPNADWRAQLITDLRRLGPAAAASQGRIRVPLPDDRRPSDEERNVAGLETARWATADLTYRRAVLAAVGGFDERFPRAYREDADLGLRVVAAGWRIEVGSRLVEHPVRAGHWWASVGRQRGNADDALMRRLHGGDWRQRAGAPAGRFRRHVLSTAALTVAVSAGVLGRRRSAATAGSLWALVTTEFAAARILAGPRRPSDVAAMIVTSVALPPSAVLHRLIGEVRAVVASRRPEPVDSEVAWRSAPASVSEALGSG
jgi:hypothetical protein